MKKYILIDTANMFFRARHIAARAQDTWEKIGMALHLTLNSVNRVNKKFSGDHVVFCLDGRSWRKDFYLPYKRNRSDARAAQTEKEAEEDRMFWETYDMFCEFLRTKTNCSVLRHDHAEADDIIARFIHLHPDDHHYIISSDSDYAQLISDRVQQYNGVSGELITLEGYFDDRGKPVTDKKTKTHKQLGDPKYVLFEKCMRGDTSDNVFSAYPGVRTKSTKKSVGLVEAYADRENRGFNWNNLMLQRWTDHEGQEHRVLDDYLRNRTLIDLTAQPDHVKQYVDETVRTGVRHTVTAQVGIHFMRFCGKYDLVKISEDAESYARWLNTPYTGVLSNDACS